MSPPLPSERPAAAAVAEGLRFLRAARVDPELHARLDALPPGTGLTAACELAQAAGFGVTEAGLRAAYTHDWGMRWAHYASAEGASRSATSAARAAALVKSASSPT
jgi:hypothetical protein